MKRYAFMCCLLLCGMAVMAQTPDPNLVPHKGPRSGVPGDTSLHLDLSTPQELAAIRQVDALCKRGKAALRAGDYSTAEADFRATIVMNEDWTQAYAGLAEVLTSQGKVAEAIQVYRTVIYELPLKYNISADTPAQAAANRAEVYQNPTKWGGFGTGSQAPWLHYVVLLCRTGQWAEAVNLYELELPGLPGGELPKINLHFDPNQPQPAALEAAAHVALGLDADWYGDDQGNYDHERGLREYTLALTLAPDWDVANYYYAYELKRLGHTAQAQAAFTKTIKMARGGVKAAAEQALKRMKKPA